LYIEEFLSDEMKKLLRDATSINSLTKEQHFTLARHSEQKSRVDIHLFVDEFDLERLFEVLRRHANDLVQRVLDDRVASHRQQQKRRLHHSHVYAFEHKTLNFCDLCKQSVPVGHR
jgi:hypothetical protein